MSRKYSKILSACISFIMNHITKHQFWNLNRCSEKMKSENALWTSSHIICAEFVSLKQLVTIFSRRMWKMITHFHSLLSFHHQTHDANLWFLANGIQQAFHITWKLRNKSDCKFPFLYTYSIQSCNIQSFIVYLMTLLAAPAMGDNKCVKGFCEETWTKDNEWKT